MERYHFHVRIRDKLDPDLEGIEVRDLVAARMAAIDCLREFLQDDPRAALTIADHCQFEIASEFDVVVLTLPFAIVIDDLQR